MPTISVASIHQHSAFAYISCNYGRVLEALNSTFQDFFVGKIEYRS